MVTFDGVETTVICLIFFGKYGLYDILFISSSFFGQNPMWA